MVNTEKTSTNFIQILYPPLLLISAKQCLVHNILSNYHSAWNGGGLPIVNFDPALFICLTPPLGFNFPLSIPYTWHSAQTITKDQGTVID